jgi:hypothetical protein
MLDQNLNLTIAFEGTYFEKLEDAMWSKGWAKGIFECELFLLAQNPRSHCEMNVQRHV